MAKNKTKVSRLDHWSVSAWVKQQKWEVFKKGTGNVALHKIKRLVKTYDPVGHHHATDFALTAGDSKSFDFHYIAEYRRFKVIPNTRSKLGLSKCRKNVLPSCVSSNKSSAINPASNDFLKTYEWRKVRMQAIKRYGAICACCGASPSDGEPINIDHIKPRRLFPHLALDIDNLQPLCGPCNHGKGNWDMTDWRSDDAKSFDPRDDFAKKFG